MTGVCVQTCLWCNINHTHYSTISICKKVFKQAHVKKVLRYDFSFMLLLSTPEATAEGNRERLLPTSTCLFPHSSDSLPQQNGGWPWSSTNLPLSDTNLKDSFKPVIKLGVDSLGHLATPSDFSLFLPLRRLFPLKINGSKDSVPSFLESLPVLPQLSRCSGICYLLRFQVWEESVREQIFITQSVKEVGFRCKRTLLWWEKDKTEWGANTVWLTAPQLSVHGFWGFLEKFFIEMQS